MSNSPRTLTAAFLGPKIRNGRGEWILPTSLMPR